MAVSVMFIPLAIWYSAIIVVNNVRGDLIDHVDQKKEIRGDQSSVDPVVRFYIQMLTEEDEDDLLIALDSRTEHVQRLNVRNNSLTDFPLQFTNTFCMVYLSSLRSLLVSMVVNSNFTLKLFNIDNRTLTTLRQGVLSEGMAVNGDQTVFMTTAIPEFTVSRLEIDGWRLTPLYTLPQDTVFNQLIGIAVDPWSMRIYASTRKQLISMDYHGRNVEINYVGRYMRSVTIDPSGNVYFNSNRKIMRTSSLNDSTEVRDLGYTPSDILYHNNNIYILDYQGKKVNVVDLHSENHTLLQTLQSKPYAMCLIPSDVI